MNRVMQLQISVRQISPHALILTGSNERMFVKIQ